MSVWVYKRHGISPQECACTGKEFYASLDYIKHNHFPQCLWNDICLTSTFQKNHTCICIVGSWYLNQPPFEHHISYFLLMPQKSLIYNRSNFFFKEKKNCQSSQILPTESPRQVPYRKLIFGKKTHTLQINVCQNQPSIWLRYAYLQWNPALPQHTASCIPLLLFHTKT